MLQSAFIVAIFCVATLYALPTRVVNNGSCTVYANTCRSNEECCYYPMTMCLPDVHNTNACLSPLDLLNLAPSFTASDIINSLLANLGNATKAILDVVKINGETVYNKSEPVTHGLHTTAMHSLL